MTKFIKAGFIKAAFIKARFIKARFIKSRFIAAVCLLFLISLPNVKAAESQPLFELSNYSGKVVYLDFWASWCVPCRKSFPWMNQLRQKYSKEELVIIAVNLDREHQLATEFLKTYPADFEVIFDPKGELAKKYQIPGMPSSILFDQQGKVITAHSGFFQDKIPEYELEIAQVISKQKEQ